MLSVNSGNRKLLLDDGSYGLEYSRFEIDVPVGASLAQKTLKINKQKDSKGIKQIIIINPRKEIYIDENSIDPAYKLPETTDPTADWAGYVLPEGHNKIYILGDFSLPNNQCAIRKFKCSNIYRNFSSLFYNISTPVTFEKDAFKGVTNLLDMFAKAGTVIGSSITDVDLSGQDLSSVEDFGGGFGSSNIKNINVSNTNTINSRSFFYTFSSPNILGIDFTGFSMNKTSDASFMFNGSNKLTRIDMSSVKETSVVTTRKMFSDCKLLEYLDIRNMDLSKNRNLTGMFNGCHKLFPPDLSTNRIESIITMDHMYNSCGYGVTEPSLLNKILDISSWKVENLENMSNAFRNTNIAGINFTGWNPIKVTNMDACFSDSKITSIDLTPFSVSPLTNINRLLLNTFNLTSVDMSGLDLTRITEFLSVFENDKKLTSIIMTGVKLPKNLLNMQSAFCHCESLETVDVSMFAVADLAQNGMYKTFQWCYKLKNIIGLELLNPNDTIVGFFATFHGCRSLSGTLDLSTLVKSSVRDISYICRECTSLTKIIFNNIEKSNITNMNYAFYQCSSLQELDLTSFNTSKATISNMLTNVPPTCVIKINPTIFINKDTGVTITPADVGWTGTFTTV